MGRKNRGNRKEGERKIRKQSEERIITEGRRRDEARREREREHESENVLWERILRTGREEGKQRAGGSMTEGSERVQEGGREGSLGPKHGCTKISVTPKNEIKRSR